MKRHILFLAILAIIWIVPCYGDPIGRDKAVTIAGRFLRNGGSRTLDASLKVTNDVPGTKAPEAVPYFIIEDPAGGFVIVSNETAMVPILGYSYTGSVGTGMQMAPALKEWLGAVGEGVSQIRKKGFAASSETRRLWDKVLVATKGGAGVQPVVELETAQWNQREPFNALCPEIDGNRTLTGCMPTATAIIMRFHKWPDYSVNVHVDEYEQGIKLKKYKIDGVSYTDYAPYGGWDIDYAYDWNNMPLSNGKDFSPEQTQAVAILMRDIGGLQKAVYASTETAADVYKPRLLWEKLGYDRNMRQIDHYYYTHGEFVSLIQEEITKGRPVLMIGWQNVSPYGGHAFVADGVDADGNVRMNWGWGGAGNGYFSMAPLDENDMRASYYFSEMMAWVSIQPDKGGTPRPIPYVHTMNIVNEEPDWSELIDVRVECAFSDYPMNFIREDIQCEIAIGVRDENSKLLEIVSIGVRNPRGELIKTTDGIIAPSMLYRNIVCQMSKTPAPGSYLCVNYRYDTSEEWKEARCDIGQGHGRVQLNETQSLASKTSLYITRTNHLEPMGSFFRDSKVIKINTIKGTYAELYYVHDGIEEILDDGLYISSNGQYDYTEGIYHIYLDELKAGRYIVRLKKDLQKYEFSFEI